MMIYKNGRNIILNVPNAIADRAVLKEAQVLDLADIGIKIAAHYGKPQDIEWAYRGGEFFIVQARPITTLG